MLRFTRADIRAIGFMCLTIACLLGCLGLFCGVAFAAAALQPSPDPVGPVVRHWAPPANPGAFFWGWAILTGVVNTVFHFATPADVDAWAEKNPRVAQLAAVIRRFGFEPVAGLKAIMEFFAGNPPPLGHAVAIGKRVVPTASARMQPLSNDPFPKPVPPSSRGFADLRLLPAAMAGAVILGAGLLNCDGLRPVQVPATTLGLCVADVAEQHPGLTLLEYVAIALEDCGADALAVIDAVLQSENPAVKPLQPAAADLKNRGGEALKTFVGQVHTRVAARQAARRAVDAGPRP